MSEETENVETQEADAPLINVDAKEEETQAEAPMLYMMNQKNRNYQKKMMMKFLSGQITIQKSFGMTMGQTLKSLRRVMQSWRKHLDPASIKHRKVITMFRIWLIVASIWKIRLLRYIRNGLKSMAFLRKRLRTWLVKFWR